MGWLGVGLLLLQAAAWLAFGGVHPGTRAALHLGLAAAAAATLALGDRPLGHAGRMLPLAGAAAALWGCCALGLLPLPRLARLLLAPAQLADRPTGWWTLSLDPEATVGELCDLALPLGMGLLAATWGAAWWRRTGIERAMRFGGSPWRRWPGATSSPTRPGCSAWCPRASPRTRPSGRRSSTRTTPARRSRCCSRRRSPPRSTGGRAARIASAGPGGGARPGHAPPSARAGRCSARASPWRLLWLRLGARRWLAAAACARRRGRAGLGLADRGAGATFHQRADAWRAGLATVPGHWLAGTGGGTFERAVQPGVHDFVRWGHAHNELVEWVTEHGMLGVAALGSPPGACGRARRRRPTTRTPPRAAPTGAPSAATCWASRCWPCWCTPSSTSRCRSRRWR
ncbi:MAG: O-antigen ligase family protein [Myxococcota bacterium]